MAMTRKHYVEVAKIISRQVADNETLTPVRREAANTATRQIADDLAYMFKYDNPHFDRNRFMDAASLGDPNGN
jgi:hypothetical protein